MENGSFDSLPDALAKVAEHYGFPSWSKLKVYVESIGSMGKFEQAIQDDDDDRVKLLLRDDPGLIHREGHWVKRRRHNGYLPLAYAAFFGKVNVMTALIEAGANVRDGEDKALRAAACFDQNLTAVELLIRHGADPNAATTSPSGVTYRVIDYPCMTLAPAMLDHLVSRGWSAIVDQRRDGPRDERSQSPGEGRMPARYATGGVDVSKYSANGPSSQGHKRSQCAYEAGSPNARKIVRRRRHLSFGLRDQASCVVRLCNPPYRRGHPAAHGR